MIDLKIDNLFDIPSVHGVSKAELDEKSPLATVYIEKIKTRGQGFYNIIDERSPLKAINDFARLNREKYDHFVVLGIGGSALGAICIAQSLSHLFKPPKLIVLDNIDPVMIREIEDVINLDKTLFIVVTKSGSTPETLSQFFYFREKCAQKSLPLNEHFVFITDPAKGLLRKISKEEGISSFEVPENIGGRFSVLTAVGLLPAAMMGLDVETMITGAKHIRDTFLNPSASENTAFTLAAIQYILLKKGKTINVMMPYAQKLIRFADWYRQLLAESIGKRTDRDGDTVTTGITPVNALGATDQHSQSQLYNEGPNDKLHIFIKVAKTTEGIQIPFPYPHEESVAYLKNVDFARLLNTEMEGTVRALTQNGRPNITVEIDKINEENLGGLFMLFEGATAFLGEFLNIDAFDQPGVELSKQITKQLLQKQHD